MQYETGLINFVNCGLKRWYAR